VAMVVDEIFRYRRCTQFDMLSGSLSIMHRDKSNTRRLLMLLRATGGMETLIGATVLLGRKMRVRRFLYGICVIKC